MDSDQFSTDEVKRLRAELKLEHEWRQNAEKLYDEAKQQIGAQRPEIERLRERERQAAVILATMLACGDYQSHHAHWLKDAVEWLNARTGT